MTNFVPPGPLAYEGSIPIPFVLRTFDPPAPSASPNQQFHVPTLWINTSSGKAWLLTMNPLGAAFWLLIGGSGIGPVQGLTVQTGTTPVFPNSSGLITLNGAAVAAGTHPVRTDGTGTHTAAVEVQTAQAIASTDATKIGLASFSSAQFSVDANGFVTLSGSGDVASITATAPLTANGVSGTPETGAVTVALTTPLVVQYGGTGDSTLTAHSVLIGNGTSSVAQVGPSGTTGAPLLSTGSSANPAYSTTFLVNDAAFFAQESASLPAGAPQLVCTNTSTTVGASARIVIDTAAQGVTSDSYVFYIVGGSAPSSWQMGAQGTAMTSNFVLQYNPSNTHAYMDGTTVFECDTSGNISSLGQISAKGDNGGLASSTSLTSTNSTTISTGTGTVKMSSANNANNAAWIKIYVGTTAYWIPAWTTNSP